MTFLPLFLVRLQVDRKFQNKRKVVPGEHDVKIYMRMAVLAGFGWTIGFILFVLPDGQHGFKRYLAATFKYLFILLNATPGLFIFVVYVCNRRVLTLYRQLLARIWDFLRSNCQQLREVIFNCRHLCLGRTKIRLHRFVHRKETDHQSFTISSTIPTVMIPPNPQGFQRQIPDQNDQFHDSMDAYQRQEFPSFGKTLDPN